MGVKGLWQLISSSGSPVTLESLENKVLAIDVSIWLHQSVRGFKSIGGESVANAHLLTLFHRICKLLFYRIRPIFVFDGGVPQLKKQTLSARRLKREVAAGKAQKVRERLLSNLLKSDAVRKALGKKGPVSSVHVSKPSKKQSDMFDLPPLNQPLMKERTKATSDGSDSESEDYIFKSVETKNLHDFEYNDADFKLLPLQKQHEILSELNITRKENSWGTINQMPEKSDNFSSFQLNRLLKRKEFQDNLDGISSKIQKTHSAQVEAQLFSDLEKYVSLTNRIVSEDSSHSVLIKNLKAKEEVEGETIRDMIKNQESLSKEPVSKKDFLCELTKQGIVSTIDAKTLSPNDLGSNSDSDYNELSDDDSNISIKAKVKMEEASFLKAVDYVLDESDLSQEEILSLIKQSQVEIETEIDENLSFSKAKSSNFADPNMPSTSKNAPGIVCGLNVESSSDDEDEFIDVPIEDDCIDFSHFSYESQNDTLNSSNKNENVILGAQSESPYIKLTQKMLNSPNKCESLKRDSRKLSLDSPDKSSKLSNEVKSLEKSVSINFDEEIKNGNLKDDIFADIFDNKIKETLGSKKEDKVLIDEQKGIAGISHEGKNNQQDFNEDKSLLIKNDKLDDKLKKKLEDLVAEELVRMTKTRKQVSTNEGSTSKISSIVSQHESSKEMLVQDDAKSNEDADDVEWRSVSKDDKAPEEDKEMENKEIDDNQTEHITKSNTELEDPPANETTSVKPSNPYLSQLNDRKAFVEAPLKYSKEELKNLEANLAKEQQTLLSEAHSVERVALDISNQVYGEAQELLQIFGLPYIVAPMEAEAQCAFLDCVGLSNGSITDDSDIFLFGGKRVYKNFFNQSKHVECFTIDSVYHNFGLDREKLITLALLTGSDYTIGIESVGAVLGMEILGEFPGSGFECLENFKKWWKKSSNSLSLERTLSKTKQRLSNLYLPDSFPNEYIYKAYLSPEVDESKEKFTWAVPNAENLKQFAAEKFGWSQSKTSEMLIPVFKKLGLKESQMRIDSYFSSIKLIKDSPHHSKRLKDAIDRTKGEFVEELPKKVKKLIPQKTAIKKKKKSSRKMKRREYSVEKSDDDGETSKNDSEHTEENLSKEMSVRKKSIIQNGSSESKGLECCSIPQARVTASRENKKLSNFKKLLEKEKILQAEKEEQEKIKKRAAAALVLAKSKQKSRNQRK